MALLRQVIKTDDFKVLCKVFYGLTWEEEAELFALQNGDAKAVNTAYKLRAFEIAGYEDVVAFLEATRSCGFKIDPVKGYVKDGTIVAVKKANQVYDSLGEEQYKKMLCLIRDTWRMTAWSVSQNMLSGMALLINAGIAAAYEADIAKLKGNSKIAPPLTALKTPIRDGDAERPGDEAYANRFFLNAHANSKPGIVDASLNPIVDPDEIYSGMKAKVSLSFFGYNNSGNKGIGVSINNVMKVADGPRLGGKASAAEDFGDLVGDDDMLS